ncbi:hypothetical protein D3C77_666280 [compost metagenome]
MTQCLGVVQRIIKRPRRRDLQAARVSEFMDGKGFAECLCGAALERLARLAGYPWRPGIGLGPVEQRLGIAVERIQGNV